MKPLSLAVIYSLLTACSISHSQPPVQDGPHPADKMRIALVGDSTQTANAGYGLGFCANLTGDVTCINDAKGGASTKTYYQQGYWEKALADKPDYMLIQFGHNDVAMSLPNPRRRNQHRSATRIMRGFSVLPFIAEDK